MNKLRLQRILLRTLRETIKIHGPITKPLMGSVVKRQTGELQSEISNKKSAKVKK